MRPMHNIWLVIQREYLERVRTRAFIVFTLLIPAIMTVMMVLPAKLATVGKKSKHIVLVTSSQHFGDIVRQRLLSAATATGEDQPQNGTATKQRAGRPDIIEVDSNPTVSERTVLRGKVDSGAIDGYLWLTDQAIAAGKVRYFSRSVADFGESSFLSKELNHIILYARLTKEGLVPDQIDKALKPLKVNSVRIEHGREVKGSGTGKFLEVAVMVLLLYSAVLFYGISVMRSVLEEKNSRVLEVLLSSATSTELMTGKLFGVAAVGLTQIVVWSVMAGAIALPTLAVNPALSDLQIQPGVLAAFAVFFLLGYLLYSTLYAVVGAITTTDQEGQQLQFLIMVPMVIALLMMVTVIRTPNASAVVWMSMVPFFSPILMFVRIVVQTPPLWQIALSVLLLVLTTAGTLVACARIYRIGILIYGKRPTLPEILKWLKYAKT
jgi:ABC-2 type transport system permease protein